MPGRTACTANTRHYVCKYARRPRGAGREAAFARSGAAKSHSVSRLFNIRPLRSLPARAAPQAPPGRSRLLRKRPRSGRLIAAGDQGLGETDPPPPRTPTLPTRTHCSPKPGLGVGTSFQRLSFLSEPRKRPPGRGGGLGGKWGGGRQAVAGGTQR